MNRTFCIVFQIDFVFALTCLQPLPLQPFVYRKCTLLYLFIFSVPVGIVATKHCTVGCNGTSTTTTYNTLLQQAGFILAQQLSKHIGVALNKGRTNWQERDQHTLSPARPSTVMSLSCVCRPVSLQYERSKAHFTWQTYTIYAHLHYLHQVHIYTY